MTLPNTATPLVLVLDTNVVLDWLLFDDPRVAGLGSAISGGQARWVATVAMRDELEHVLLRGIASRRGHETASILQSFDSRAELMGPTDRPVPPALRCADPDDQMFIDLGLQLRAATLLSRDRAVLRLARAATSHGLRITTPELWAS